MLKKLLPLFFIGVFVCGDCEGQVTFIKTYGGSFDDYGESIQQTIDGGYILAGTHDNDIYLIKTDVDGDTLWTKFYGGVNQEWGYSVQQTTDGGYIIVGFTDDFGLWWGAVYLIKTDAAGNALWSKTFGGLSTAEGFSVEETNDGGYIMVGSAGAIGAGGSDVYLIKLNTMGNIQWTKTFGGVTADEGYSVQQTNDSGYIVVGSTLSFGAGNYDIYLIRTDANGDTLWTKTYGGSGSDLGECIQQTTDQGYIIAGSTNSFGPGGYDVYLIKTDSGGNIAWTKTFGGINDDQGYSIQQTSDGGYIVVGSCLTLTSILYDVYLIKTNIIGDTLWTKAFDLTSYDYGFSVRETNDGGYIIVGGTSFNTGNSNVLLIKTDASGNVGCNENSISAIVTSPVTQVLAPATVVSSGGTMTSQIPVVESGSIIITVCTTVGVPEIDHAEISIYPNPFTHSLTIQSHSSGKKEIILFDVTGKEILRQQTSEAEIKLNTEGISAGFYLLRVEGENFKVVKSKE
jgi:hypothetical protein